jgi:toxin ParE1/3/4
MTRRIVIRPKASVDLDEQFAYIADSNFDAALSFFDATRQTFSQLARLPGIGSVYNVKNPRLNPVQVETYSFFYSKTQVFKMDRV